MILDKEIYVIDDFIDDEYQKDIRNILMGNYQYRKKDFPWYYTEDITAANDPDSQHRTALGHDYVVMDDENDETGERLSEFHYLFLPMLKDVCRRMNIKNINVLQGRSFLQFPLNLKDRSVDTPHVDLFHREHLVVLYYVCDSDGDTVIYNERYGGGSYETNGSKITYNAKEKLETYTIKQRVTPKQGRIVLFDGSLYHTAQQPLNNVRCIVNYNLG